MVIMGFLGYILIMFLPQVQCHLFFPRVTIAKYSKQIANYQVTFILTFLDKFYLSIKNSPLNVQKAILSSSNKI